MVSALALPCLRCSRCRYRWASVLQQPGDLVGVDLVDFGLAAVDGFHVQGMAEDERDVLCRAQIGEPLPEEDALHADHHLVAVGAMAFRNGSGAERRLRCSRLQATRMKPRAPEQERYAAINDHIYTMDGIVNDQIQIHGLF